MTGLSGQLVQMKKLFIPTNNMQNLLVDLETKKEKNLLNLVRLGYSDIFYSKGNEKNLISWVINQIMDKSDITSVFFEQLSTNVLKQEELDKYYYDPCNKEKMINILKIFGNIQKQYELGFGEKPNFKYGFKNQNHIDIFYDLQVNNL